MKDAADIMVCTPSAVYHRVLQHRKMTQTTGPWDVTFGMVFDWQRRVNGRVRPLDHDNLWEWGKKNNFLLARHRWLAIRFLRAAYAAHTAGLPIEEAEFTSHQWLWWGVSFRRLTLWQGKPGQDKWWWDRIRIGHYHMRSGKRMPLRIYNVRDVLDWFILTSAIRPEERSPSTDFLRDRLRMIEAGVMQYQQSQRVPSPIRALNAQDGRSREERKKGTHSYQWDGAVGLQRAWNAYHRLCQAEAGHQPGKAAITPRRINGHLSKAIELLATTDPDWTRRPIDLATIRPDYQYAVLMPDYSAFEQDIQIHTPAGAQLIQVFYEAQTRTTLVKNAQSFGQPTDRVAYVSGAHIHNYPHAYTA
jgi:hypothetical protein